MRLILYLVLSTAISSTIRAQDQQGMHFFSYLPEDKAIAEYFSEFHDLVSKKYSTMPSGSQLMTQVNADSFLVYYARMETAVESGTWEPWMMVSQGTDANAKTWVLTPAELGTLGFIQRISFEESGVFLHQDTPLLWITFRTGHHSHSGYSNAIFALKDEVVKQIGVVPGYFHVDYEGGVPLDYNPREFAKVGGLFVTESGLEVERQVRLDTMFGGFDYYERYLATKDTLLILDTNKPGHFISYQKADSLLQATLDLYYREDWQKAVDFDPAGSRPEIFQHYFGDLTVLRADYAPAHYNFACMRALVGATHDAFESLKIALELDPQYLEKAMRDPDLEGVRGLPAFRDLMPE